MLKKTRIDRAPALAFGGGVVFGALAPQALAHRVEITGSSIRQISSETALPVTVLKTDELAKAGVTNAEQALAFITSNQAGITSARSVGESNGGASYADLRGLGPARTLVLLNGKRLVMNPYDSGTSPSAVDLNTIPYGAVDRIEVLNDGASALYGSDAIAGVINFITKTEYQGLTLSGSAQLPTSSGGGQVYDISVTGGIGSLSEQKWNLFGGLTYRKQRPLSALDRGFAKTSEFPDRATYFSSFSTFPANYYQPATPGLQDEVFNPTAPGCDPPNSLPGGSLCYFDYVRFLNIVPEQEQLSAIVKGTLAVNNDNTVSLEYVQGNNKLTSVVAPTTVSWSMPSANPFYPGQNGLAGVPGTPANNLLNTSAPIDLDWRTVSLGSRVSTFDNKTDRLLLDWQGAYKNWFYSAAIMQSNSDVTNTFNGGYVKESAIRAGLEGTATLNGAQVWLNPFGNQTPEGSAYLNSQRIGGQVQRAEGKLFGIKADASGEIYKLPAGPLTMGVGIEYYRDRVDYTNNFALIREAASSGLEGTQDSSGSRNWWGLFAEFNIPVVKTVDVTLAARYDDYSDFGGTFNPKAAIRWAPSKELLFRGSVNSGFRAPSLFQAYSPTSITNTAGNRLNDPVLCPGGVVNAAAGGVQGRDCGQTFDQQIGGNPSLEPETSTAWSVGLVFQPTASSTVSIDYWNYVVKDTINQVGEDVIFGNPSAYSSSFVRCSKLSVEERKDFTSCSIPGGDPLAYIINTNQNLGNYKTSGIDFSAGWRSQAYPFGRFSVGWQATWLLEYEYQLEDGGPYFNNLGTYFNGQPISRYRQVLNLGWQYQDWSASLINRYSRGYTDDNNPDYVLDPAYYNTVGATNTWDLAVTWTGIKGLVVTAGVTNLFDQEPPFSNQSTLFQVGYDARYANPIGRAFLLRASYSF